MNIVLIGMAGVGKSAIGKTLAKAMHCEFIDLDERIEKKFKLTLQEILDQVGETRFIEIERQAALDLSPLDHAIISPGGSVIYSAEAMTFFKNNSVVIFLDAPFESIKKRITNLSTRGIVGLKSKSLKDLYHERRSLYQTYADLTVTMTEKSKIDQVVRKILQHKRIKEMRQAPR